MTFGSNGILAYNGTKDSFDLTFGLDSQSPLRLHYLPISVQLCLGALHHKVFLPIFLDTKCPIGLGLKVYRNTNESQAFTNG